jgi:hypothetical protein
MTSRPRFDLSVVNRFLLHKQHLYPETKTGDAVRVARDTAGLHATYATTPYLSVWARSPGAPPEALSRELEERRTLARIRCIRGTIYIQPRDWIAAFQAATRRRNLLQTTAYTRRAGVSEREYSSVSSEVASLLVGSPKTAASLRRALGFAGDLSAVLYRMCDEGTLLREAPEKGWRDRSLRYALFRETFPEIDLDKIDGSAAILAVVTQYLRCFGPATEQDVVWWTGSGRGQIKAALNGLGTRIVQVGLGEEGRGAWLLEEDVEALSNRRRDSEAVVNLLPTLDGYLMGYRERDRYLRPEHAGVVFDRSGNVTSTVLADGRIVGVWDGEEAEEPLVKLHFLVRVSEEVRRAAVQQARELGRFLFGRDAGVAFCEAMVPLTRRPAGSVMAPLKGTEATRRVA